MRAFSDSTAYGNALKVYQDLLELEQKYIPQGFVQPAEIRADIRADVEDLFKGFAREDVETAYELLSRINNAHGKAPDVQFNDIMNIGTEGNYGQLRSTKVR